MCGLSRTVPVPILCVRTKGERSRKTRAVNGEDERDLTKQVLMADRSIAISSTYSRPRRPVKAGRTVPGRYGRPYVLRPAAGVQLYGCALAHFFRMVIVERARPMPANFNCGACKPDCGR